MFSLLDQLKKLDKPIHIGIVGIGSIGRGMVLQAQMTPGVRCVAISDVILEKATTVAEQFNCSYQVVDSLAEMHDAIRNEKLAVCQDGELVAECELADVFVEATNSLPDGGRYALLALQSAKHCVMMNYEADLMFGCHLMHVAHEKDLVYSVCDGDQPAVITRLISELQFMGLDLVMAGNIKGFLDRYSNPTAIIPEADKRDLDYKMCTSYTDGTKLGIEMAVLANGLGLRTDVPGMHGPIMEDIHEVFNHYDFDAIYATQKPVVDYVLKAKPYGGVFAIGYTDHPYQQRTLAWFPPNMGPGPYYLFYRPYHLGHFESMATIAEAVLNHRAVLQPKFGLQTNVFAYAKKELCRGEALDGLGGYTCYGMIENYDDNIKRASLPICLAENVVLKRNIRKNEKIYFDDVEYNADNYSYGLYTKAVAASNQIRF